MRPSDILALEAGAAAGGPAAGAVFDVERSVLGRRWLPRLDPRGEIAAQAIAQRHALPDVLARILAGRGVDLDAVEPFLAPTLRAYMPDPSRITDMDAAVARLADAVARGEPIAAIADYDVDGATSAAVLGRVLAAVGSGLAVHVPDRLTEGYGASVAAVEALAAGGARLLLTLDCGTSSHDAVARGRALGLDVIVVDHHPPGEGLPPATAVVNPNRQDDLSGLGHLAAVGVTFMLAVALNRELRRRGRYATGGEPDLAQLLDLVALGTVADVVPLIGLNRAFVVRGLAVMRRRTNPGLAALADAARLAGPPSAYHLGFLLGPRINAGGRIGDAGLGARLMTTEDAVLAATIAAELDSLNRDRQEIEAAALAEAEAMAVAAEGAAVVVAGDWHPGVVGLVAARLVERTGRPALALALRPDGTATGSARSLPGIDFGAAVAAAAAAGILIKGGGHAMAAGVTLDQGRIGDLVRHLDDRFAGLLATAGGRDIAVDAAISARGATAELARRLEEVGPYGAGHPEPVFVLPQHRIADARVVGSGHVKVTLASGDGARVEGMAFRAADRPHGQDLLAARGERRHVAAALGLDRFRGEEKAVLRILDVATPR